MASLIYTAFKQDLLSGLVNLGSDTIKVILMGSGYTPSINNDHNYSDVIAHETSGNNYSAGGITLANKIFTNDLINHKSVFKADYPTWVFTTMAAIGAVVYKYSGDPATSPLICYFDFNGLKTTLNSKLIIRWVNGILEIT